MSELGKPEEFSARQDHVVQHRRARRATVVVLLAVALLFVVLLAVSGCIPTP